MKSDTKNSKKNIKQILLLFVVGAVCAWLIFLLWNFSEVGMMRKTLEVVGHKPEKVYVDFPESEVFGERIFYKDEISYIAYSGGPTYQQKVTFERFKELINGEVYAVLSYCVVDQKVRVILTGNTIVGVMRYFTIIEKEIDIPKGKRFVGLKYVCGVLEISQQPDFGVASWRLVVERLLYLIIIVVILILLWIEWFDKKVSEEKIKHYRTKFHEEQNKAVSCLNELYKAKERLDEIDRQNLDEGSAGD